MLRCNCQPPRFDTAHAAALEKELVPHRSFPGCLLAEQRVGSIAMGGGLVPVGGHASHLGFQQGDPVIELVLRIRAKILGSKLACGVACEARVGWLVHGGHFRAGKRVLSMGAPVWWLWEAAPAKAPVSCANPGLAVASSRGNMVVALRCTSNGASCLRGRPCIGYARCMMGVGAR